MFKIGCHATSTMEVTPHSSAAAMPTPTPTNQVTEVPTSMTAVTTSITDDKTSAIMTIVTATTVYMTATEPTLNTSIAGKTSQIPFDLAIIIITIL